MVKSFKRCSVTKDSLDIELMQKNKFLSASLLCENPENEEQVIETSWKCSKYQTVMPRLSVLKSTKCGEAKEKGESLLKKVGDWDCNASQGLQ